jgi:NAD(P)-dependent dehydrogenase (short-subunit alcohol dehydrogenase family)
LSQVVFAFKGVNAGGARGIGMATVEFFHEHGAILEFADVNDQNGKALESQLKE